MVCHADLSDNLLSGLHKVSQVLSPLQQRISVLVVQCVTLYTIHLELLQIPAPCCNPNLVQQGMLHGKVTSSAARPW